MSGRVFVDTNVLVYAHDTTASVKHEVAGPMASFCDSDLAQRPIVVESVCAGSPLLLSPARAEKCDLSWGRPRGESQ